MMRALLKTVGGQPDKDDHEEEEGQYENVKFFQKEKKNMRM